MLDGFELSEHAQYEMRRRNIQASWIEEALSAPERLLPLADSHGNTHHLKRIPSFGDRWLRIVVNPNVYPKRVVTLFFDRRVK
jgi:Domain of unknown function (DUF4258)